MSPARKKAAKRAAAKRPTRKRPAAKRATATRAAAKRTASGARAHTAARAAATRGVAEARNPDADALAARAAAKAHKRDRARRRQAHLAARFGSTNLVALEVAMHAALERAAPTAAPARRPRKGARLMAQATTNRNRWVPIGPSVVRRGQADGRPRVAGRIRDLQLDATGQRAYAASGKGGVWYTEDAGTTWRPIGGWASAPGRTGGLSTDMSCGCLHVSFGATAAEDYVMVGTGEERAGRLATGTPVFPDMGGRGVLASRGPANADQTAVPFELQTGIATGLENTAIARLARDPARPALAEVAALGDRVLAATSGGLYLGTRANDAGGTPEWQWARITGLDSLATAGRDRARRPIPIPLCDVQWLATGTANGRIYVASPGRGVAWSDRLGATGSWQFITFAAPVGGAGIEGRLSLAAPVDGRLYILLSTARIPTGSPNTAHEPYLYRIPDALRAAGPAQAVRVRGVPSNLWTNSDAQRDWDQALTVERVGGTDRVWLGGSAVTPYAGADWSACVYCFDVSEAGAGAPSLAPAVGVSRVGDPALGAGAGGDGADIAGLVGNNVHADVHCIRVVTLADGTRHVWVGCDGGIYCSELGGRVNTFAPRATGLAVLETIFLANHPSSGHYCAVGSQDNGSQVRTGDMVWELVQLGDGGGQMFHPVNSQYLVSQFTNGNWSSDPAAGFVDPLAARVGGGPAGAVENNGASFYSGCDAVGPDAGLSRVAIGTNRVWISDDLGTAATNSWRVLPFSLGAAAPATDPRATAAPESAANLRVGVYRPPPARPRPPAPQPFPAFGNVEQLRWAGARRLFAVYSNGIVRFDDDGADNWQATVLLPSTLAGAPNPSALSITEIAPLPNRRDFYFTTLGDADPNAATATDTLWFYQDVDPAVPGSVATCVPTLLRRQLPPSDPSPPVGAPALGPLDPAHSVVVDPDDPNTIYVGTTGGVWHGVRTPAANTWAFTPFMNGVPATCVSDLSVIRASAAAPKLLRAATRSRGVWEVLLGAVDEPPSTYLRVHAHDSRRMPETPMADPRLAPTVLLPAHNSPDIVVRPAPRGAALPALRFPLAAGQSIGAAHAGSVHLWTFQTAFRWFFPSVRADAQWTDQLGDLVRAFRVPRGLGNADTIDENTWNMVVGTTRLSATRQVTALNTDAWAVLQPPWQTATATTVIPTEADLMELVVPNSVGNGVWRVHREPLMVDVLLHHRDTRALNPLSAYAALYFRAAADLASLLALPATPFTPVHSWRGEVLVPPVTGWTRAGGVHRLNATLDAFMPKAVSISLDLTDPAIGGPFVAMIAVCGSVAETPPAPTGLPASPTIVDLVRRWPRSALRIVELQGTRATVP